MEVIFNEKQRQPYRVEEDEETINNYSLLSNNNGWCLISRKMKQSIIYHGNVFSRQEKSREKNYATSIWLKEKKSIQDLDEIYEVIIIRCAELVVLRNLLPDDTYH